MQQTDKYNLSIIDPDDRFSPDALNENTRQVETVLARVEGGVAAALDAETARVDGEIARVDAALAAEKSARETAAAAETARVNAALGTKAEQTALTAEETARKSEITRLETALSAEQSARVSEVARLDAATARIAYGSYKGNGKYGSSNKVTLDFTDTLGEAPKLLIVRPINRNPSDYMLILIQGVTKLLVDSGAWSFDCSCTITWTDTGVSWYSPTNPGLQLNDSNATFYYVAFA